MSNPQNNSFTQNGISIGVPPGNISAYLGTIDPSGWVIADGVERLNTYGLYNNLEPMQIYSPEFVSNSPLLISYKYYKISFISGGSNNEFRFKRFFFYNETQNGRNSYDAQPTNFKIGRNSTISYKNNNNTAVVTSNEFTGFHGYATAIGSPGSLVNMYFSYTSGLKLSSFQLTLPKDPTAITAVYNITGFIIYGSNTETNYTNDDTDSTGWVNILTGINVSYPYPAYEGDLRTYFSNRYGVTYIPPNLSAAFLRGVGTNKYSTSNNTSLKSFQQMGLLDHTHSASSAAHNHSKAVDQTTATYSLRAGSTAEVTSQTTDTTGDEVNIVGYYHALTTHGTSLNTIGVTVGLMTGDYAASEMRPYNYGVNWIIKL